MNGVKFRLNHTSFLAVGRIEISKTIVTKILNQNGQAGDKNGAILPRTSYHRHFVKFAIFRSGIAGLRSTYDFKIFFEKFFEPEFGKFRSRRSDTGPLHLAFHADFGRWHF